MKLEKTDKNPKILTNLYIPIDDMTIIIDLIYITTNGIYVIENKNYKGWIYGVVDKEKWIQESFWTTQTFINPILQNKKYVNYLKKMFSNIEFKSFIVFNNRSKLKHLKVNRRLVIKRKELERRILKDKFKQIITKEEVNEIYLKLEPYSNKIKTKKNSYFIKMINKLKSQSI